MGGGYRTIRLREIGLTFVIGPGGTIAVRLLAGPTRTKSGERTDCSNGEFREMGRDEVYKIGVGYEPIH